MSVGQAAIEASGYQSRIARIIVGEAISLAGDYVFRVALVALLVVRADSPRVLASALLCHSVSTVCGLTVGGSLTDRLGSRACLLSANMMRCVAMVALAASVARGHLDAVLPSAVVLGLGDGLFQPAFTAAVPALAPPAALRRINAINGSLRSGSAVVGSALGGAVVTFVGISAAFAVNAASFAIALAALLSLRNWPATVDSETDPPLHGWVGGLRFVMSTGWLRACLASFTVVVALVVVPLPLYLGYLVRGHANAEAQLGAFLAANGVGAACGAGIFGFRVRGRLHISVWSGMAIAGLALSISVLMPSSVLVGACFFVGGAALAVAAAAWMTVLQTSVPPRLLGRVSAVDWLSSLAFAPLALAALPRLAESTSPSFVIAASGALAAVAALALGLSRGFRRLGQ